MEKYIVLHEKEVTTAASRHPMFTMIAAQFAAAVFLLGSVTAIAGTGGGIIWVVYKMLGVL